MIEINDKLVKRWSRIGQRATFGLTMVELAKMTDDLAVLTADVSTSAGLERFREQFPEHFYDVGISEQNMMGIATGLAADGNQVFTTTFAPFQTMRCLEQIRVNLGYMNSNVCMVGLASGLYHIYLGNTHCCIEDFGVLRSIPNMTILSPADGVEVVKCLEAAIQINGPVYIRLSGGTPLPVVYQKDFEYKVGVGNVLQEGTGLVIFATGTMVARALQVAEQLNNEDHITCAVVDMHTIKPIDTDVILKYKDYPLIITMEEHNVVGGLGTAVSEVLSNSRHTSKQIMFGVQDFYPHETDYEAVMDLCGLSVNKMVDRIRGEL